MKIESESYDEKLKRWKDGWDQELEDDLENGN